MANNSFQPTTGCASGRRLNSGVRVQMKIADILWSKIGFGIIGFIAGSIWCLIFYPLIKLIQPELALISLFKIFVLVFVIASLVSEKFVGVAGLGALYAIYGYFAAFTNGHIVSVDWSKTTKEVIVCFVLGVIAGGITLAWG